MPSEDYHQARWWIRENAELRCQLCPHSCLIAAGKVGICGTRKNIDGTLVSLSYGRICVSAFDPIEKKPIFHYRPGTRLYSLGTFGCNLSCDNCQNSVLAWAREGDVPYEPAAPGSVVEKALEREVQGIAWTFNEPIVWLEFILDTAEMARDNGLYTVMNTNGFVSEGALREAVTLVQAMNIDVKSFSPGFYEENCGGKLEDVLRTCRIAREAGVHVELTYLMIPGMNDSREELQTFFRWVVEKMGSQTPVHLYRFLPSHRLSHLPPQSMEKMDEAYTMARDLGIMFPYVAGVVGDERQNTYCPVCGEPVIKRRSERTHDKVVVKADEVSRFCPTYPDIEIRLKEGRCPSCGFELPFIW